MMIVHGCDPGASAGYCTLVVCATGAHVTLLGPDPNPAPCDVLAIEGQYVSRAKRTWHKGRALVVNSRAVPTLSFHAGLIAGRTQAGRILRIEPDVWRALLWADCPAAEQAIGRLRRDLGLIATAATPAAGYGPSDDEVEAYGLARAGAVVGLERRGVTPGGLPWVCEPQPHGRLSDAVWFDVRIPKPKVSRLKRGR